MPTQDTEQQADLPKVKRLQTNCIQYYRDYRQTAHTRYRGYRQTTYPR